MKPFLFRTIQIENPLLVNVTKLFNRFFELLVSRVLPRNDVPSGMETMPWSIASLERNRCFPIIYSCTYVPRQFLFSQIETAFVVLADSRLFIYGLLMS